MVLQLYQNIKGTGISITVLAEHMFQVLFYLHIGAFMLISFLTQIVTPHCSTLLVVFYFLFLMLLFVVTMILSLNFIMAIS